MSGAFVISLDFELMWGVRDHRSVAEYGDAVLGVRQALPQMIDRFRTHGLRASWAAVGFLFAKDRAELLDFVPEVLPDYGHATLSPYDFLRTGLGQDERDDPYHFGWSMLDRVAQTDGQDIGTHTHCHYYCLEPGQSAAAFAADAQAAAALAGTKGHRLQSLVFPRNQMTPDHVKIAARHGVTVWRGNPQSWAYLPRSGEDNSKPVRAVRLLDGALPLVGGLDFAAAEQQHGITNVPASRFLRPWSPKMAGYMRLHVRRIKAEMTRAAKTGRNYHLWWHPHNFGRHTEANIAQMEDILTHFRVLQDRYGWQSRNMTDFAAPAGMA